MKAHWLNDDERRAWLGLLTSTALLEVAIDDQLRRDYGLTHTTYAILAGLSESPHRTLHMQQLSMLTGNSPSRLSHAVARLETPGWVRRSPCPQNRRAVHAVLTEAGYDFITTAAPAHVSTVRRLVFDQLSPEQVRQLGEITGAVLAGLASGPHLEPTLQTLPCADV